MRSSHPLLFRLGRQALRKNARLVGTHAGESCYIFGNGASIKLFDLRHFGDKIGIGLGAIVAHEEFPQLNVRYVYEGHPFFNYPYWVNPYSRKIERNVLGAFYQEKWARYGSIRYFVSLSNFLGVSGENVHYLHHFSAPFAGYGGCALDGKFTAMASGLSGALGLALALGFTDLTLVGCDYALFPQGQGHFYEFGQFADTREETPPNRAFLLDAARRARVRVVAPHGGYRGQLIPHVGYRELTGAEPRYRENSQIVSPGDLATMNRSGMSYRIFPADAQAAG